MSRDILALYFSTSHPSTSGKYEAITLYVNPVQLVFASQLFFNCTAQKPPQICLLQHLPEGTENVCPAEVKKELFCESNAP